MQKVAWPVWERSIWQPEGHAPLRSWLTTLAKLCLVPLFCRYVGLEPTQDQFKVIERDDMEMEHVRGLVQLWEPARFVCLRAVNGVAVMWGCIPEVCFDLAAAGSFDLCSSRGRICDSCEISVRAEH